MKVKKQQFRTGHATTDWFRLGKEYVKAVYLFIAYLASMQYIIQNARLDESQAESRLLREIPTSDMQVTTL